MCESQLCHFTFKLTAIQSVGQAIFSVVPVLDVTCFQSCYKKLGTKAFLVYPAVHSECTACPA